MIFGLSAASLALIVAATLAAAFVRGLAGFGMAILLVPVLGLAIPPAEAVVVANVLGLLIGLPELRTMLRESEHTARTIALVAVLLTPAGMLLLARTDADLARLLIALVAEAAFVLVLLPQRPPHVPGRAETLLTGAASGLLTGFAGMPGPPVVPYYLGRAIPPLVARASMMLTFLATSAAGCASALALRVATPREFALGALLFPAVLLGNWLGAKAFGRISTRAWRSFTGLVLGSAALGALLKLL